MPAHLLRPPGADAYLVLLVFKVAGRRVGGGLFDLSEGNDDEAFTIDIQEEIMESALLRAFMEEDGVAVSIFMVRRRDGKCLQLVTNAVIGEANDDFIHFDGQFRPPFVSDKPNQTTFVDEENENFECSFDLFVYGLVFGEGHMRRKLIGFNEARAELKLWVLDGADFYTHRGIMLKCWHESKNWI